MTSTMHHTIARSLYAAAAALSIAACAGDAPVAPATSRMPATPQLAAAVRDEASVAATLRRVTDRYRNIETAKAEGFVLLHDCESRPGEGPVGTVYVHVGRLLDGKISAERPDALIYEPRREGRFTLVGVELAIPYAMAPNQQAPSLLGHTFQDEPEFGVFALHAWVWRDNPDGMFAETNPKVSCLS